MEKVLVLGGGESGVGAAILAKKNQIAVMVSDAGALQSKYRKDLENWKIPYEENGHSLETFFEFTKVVKSPGIPDDIALIKNFKKRNIPVVSEVEWASGFTQSTLIAITGSNGKTSTTNLIYQILDGAGLDVGLVGNVGYSFARAVALNPSKIYVLELSSFQLDGIKEFRPDIAILLNISPDHLDRYDYNFEAYADSKYRIVKNVSGKDVFIYNASDKDITKRLEADPRNFDRRGIVFENPEHSKGFRLSNPALQGMHNAFNTACAIEAARIMGLEEAQIQKGIDAFVNDPHRMELFLEVNGIRFINDSKATNVESVYYALDAVKAPVIWIVGGIDKGNEYELLDSLVDQKVRRMICLGVENEKLMAHFSESVKDCTSTHSLEAMVEAIHKDIQPGDTVLLSPACSSFDLFENYKRRGELFKEIIRAHFK